MTGRSVSNQLSDDMKWSLVQAAASIGFAIFTAVVACKTLNDIHKNWNGKDNG